MDKWTRAQAVAEVKKFAFDASGEKMLNDFLKKSLFSNEDKEYLRKRYWELFSHSDLGKHLLGKASALGKHPNGEKCLRSLIRNYPFLSSDFARKLKRNFNHTTKFSGISPEISTHRRPHVELFLLQSEHENGHLIQY